MSENQSIVNIFSRHSSHQMSPNGVYRRPPPPPPPPEVAFLLALPNSTVLTRAAKFNEQCVSSEESSVGDTQHIINVLLSLLNESWSKCVRTEFLKGMCACLFDLAMMTSPRNDRDLLMFCASFRACPVTPLRPTRSDPARSTRLSLPLLCLPLLMM